jgi:hypothetical protein
MSNTLKENYLKKIEKIKNESLEDKNSLIFEALQVDPGEISKLIEKLRSISKIIDGDPKSKNKEDMKELLQSQIDAANEMVHKKPGIFQKLLRTSKNPINQILSILSTIEEGFDQLPKIVKNNIPDADKPENKQKSIDELIEELDDKDKEKARNNIFKSFNDAFVTNKKFANLKTDLKSGQANSTTDFITGLSTLTLETLGKLSTILKNGPRAENQNLPPQGDKQDQTSKQDQESPENKKNQTRIVQVAAKEAGIKDPKTIERFLLKVMELEDGINNPYSGIAINALNQVATSNKVPDGQLDGFVDGISVDKGVLVKKINDVIAKKKAELEAKDKKKAEQQGAEGATAQSGPLGTT